MTMTFNNFIIFVIVSGLVGLIIGSFLNVVVYRLPLMLQRAWRAECKELLELPAEITEKFNLCFPRSHCTHCQHTLSWRENIPLLSYLFLKGKCLHCKKAIPFRYPLLEIISAIISVIVAWYFGFNWQCLAALLFSWSLLTLTFIDLKHQLLPDNITLPLLWLGLLLSIFNFFTDSTSALIGASIGYAALWLIAWVYQMITKKVGMGHGDFKLLAVLGAWLGWQLLPLILLVAALLGAVVGISLIALKKQTRDTPIPFGPFLAFAGWLALLWGKQIYFAWFI
jgi:leader peptidase (prepilin peptidase) / N-methyltransferase